MSLVIFPFVDEDPDTLVKNMRIAAEHPLVRHVLAIGLHHNSAFVMASSEASKISSDSGTEVTAILQDRLGTRRAGKGDAMNTGLTYFLNRTALDRVHFYDSDITSFSGDWISKAERAADRGCDVVRHYYPRARCDAMITWMITRPGFAMLWPQTYLSQIHQPLGGELLMTRGVASRLLADERVLRQSDWGIDTVYTFAFASSGCYVHEVYMGVGKQHRLYGSLSQLKTMLVECFSTIQALQKEKILQVGSLRADECDSIPDVIRQALGFDVEPTLALLMENWSEEQIDYLTRNFSSIANQMLLNRSRPTFNFMGHEVWAETYRTLLSTFVRDDKDWQELLFKLWLTRVLNYTIKTALRGYEFSQQQLFNELATYRDRRHPC